MASVFKRTITEAIPPDATITKTAKALPKSAKVTGNLATWTDRRGATLGGPLDSQGRAVVQTATLTDGRTLPITPDGKRLIVGMVARYSAAYKNEFGKWVRKSTGTTDKEAAKQIAARWEAEAKKRREGVIDRDQERQAQEASRPIGEHVQAYVNNLRNKGGSEKHYAWTEKTIREIVAAGNWGTIRDIGFEFVDEYAAQLKKDGLAARTVQSRLRAIKGFTKWLVAYGRLSRDPLLAVNMPDIRRNKKKVNRRMLLPSEWPYLLAATEAGPVRNGLSGKERAALYMLAIQTGLRAKEISTVNRSTVVLSGKAPHVTVKAADQDQDGNASGTKNKKDARQNIDRELAGRLSELARLKAKATPFFNPTTRTALAGELRKDLAVARVNWIREAKTPESREERHQSDFLGPTNAAGESLDFHALRYSCGAWLAIAGVHAKIIQTVMRHSTITLTMDTYGRLMPGAEADAIRLLSEVMHGRQTLDLPDAAAG